MRRMFVFVCLSLCVFAAFGVASGQSQKSDPGAASAETGSNRVEVKTDRFTNSTTITMKPQKILDNPAGHTITMELTVKFVDPKTKTNLEQALDSLDQFALLSFHSVAKIKTDYGDREIHFIVDGTPLRIGETTDSVLTLRKPELTLLTTFSSGLKIDQLKKIAYGKRVEMRLGTYEFVLDENLLGNIRTFVDEFVKYAPPPPTRRQGKRQ